MINTDEDALICDLAETYHIYDYKSLPVQMVATFSVGLRADSRIKMKMSGMAAEPNTLLMTAIVDRLSILLWRQTEDGVKGINPPALIMDELLGVENQKEIISFTSGEEFEHERERILKGEG